MPGTLSSGRNCVCVAGGSIEGGILRVKKRILPTSDPRLYDECLKLGIRFEVFAS